MTVAELIDALTAYPQDMPVAYQRYSEYDLLDDGEIGVVEACLPRGDGWVQRKRPDKETQNYLMFPGN